MRSALVPILLADPMPWAFKAPYAWDFLKDRARFAGGYKGALANTPGWTATPATHSAGGVLYASTASGALQSFASGTLRRTDKGVLIEGARTNLCLQSQTFDNANWVKTAATVSADAAVAPDGTTTADALIEDGTSASQHRVQMSTAATYATAATFAASVYFKAGSGSRNVVCRIGGASGSAYAVFNPSTGAVVTSTVTGANWTLPATPSAATALANGWYRGVVVASHTETSSGVTLFLQLASGSNISYDGDSASSVYLWGAQVE